MAAMNRRLLQPGEKIRVLVVDDSVVIRRLVTHALEQDSEIQVVGAAANGSIALQRIPQFNPDVLTLDIEMPEMDGLETLRHLRREYPHLRVIMFSTLTERGAAVTLEALTLGADDYVTKASNEGSLDRSMTRLQEELIPKIKQFFHLPSRIHLAKPAQTVQAAAASTFWPGNAAHVRHFRKSQGCGYRSLNRGADRSGRESCHSSRPSFHCQFWSCSTCRLSSRAFLRNDFTPAARSMLKKPARAAESMPEKF